MTFPEFMKAHRRLGTVIYPAFMLQKAIREKAMSKKFWAKATKKRETLFSGDTLDDLIEMYTKLCAEKEAFVVQVSHTVCTEEARCVRWSARRTKSARTRCGRSAF